RLLVDGAVLDITTSREHHVDGNGNVAAVLKHSYAQRIDQLHLAKNQKEICIKKQDRREEDEKVEKKETEIDQIETKGSKKAAPLFPLFYTYSDVVSLQNQLKSVTTYNCPLLLRQQQQQQQQNTAFNGKLCLKQYVWDFDQQKLRVNCNTNVLPKVMSENIFWENEHVIVVYDLFPKAKLHLLVLPKTVYIDSIHDLNPKNFAHVQTLLAISDIAQILYQQFVLAFFFFNYYSHFLSSLLLFFVLSFKCSLRNLALKHWNLRTNILCGFHIVPSLRCLHLHMLSDDLDGPYMTQKKWNCFTSDFFVPLHFMIQWIQNSDNPPLNKLDKKYYQSFGRQALICPKCTQQNIKHIDQMKKHFKTCKGTNFDFFIQNRQLDFHFQDKH
ncbi:hypothetical protein RFI_27494, partial [Reticulomyxa filosa]